MNDRGYLFGQSLSARAGSASGSSGAAALVCFAALSVSACGGSTSSGGGQRIDSGPATPATAASGSASSAQPATTEQPAADKPGTSPAGELTRRDAERHILELVNRDRKAKGLPPVKWDDTAAKAGQRHADDMAQHGFTAHLGTDGSVPEQRYTNAGGTSVVMENAGCLADGLDRELDPDPRFSAEEIERIETLFISEVPPRDGHKRTILTPWHTSLGVGLAKTKGLPVVCMAQEFVDDYGTFSPLPRKAKVGDKITVSGSLRAPAEVAGVSLSRVNMPKPMTAEQLLRTYAYPIPKPYVSYFRKGFETPIPVEVTDSSFRIEVPMSDHGKPGLYGVIVWANIPQTKDLVMVSLRTIEVN